MRERAVITCGPKMVKSKRDVPGTRIFDIKTEADLEQVFGCLSVCVLDICNFLLSF